LADKPCRIAPRLLKQSIYFCLQLGLSNVAKSIFWNSIHPPRLINEFRPG
jgi:hypothetical protein